MTSFVVCDSGVLLSTYLPDKYSLQAAALMDKWTTEQTHIVAPALMHYEIISALRKSVVRKIISTDDAAQARDELLAYAVRLLFDSDLVRRAYDLAAQLNLPTAYDSQYLAVAERLACEFWTADERLFNAVKDQLAWVKWVGNAKTGAPA